MESVLSVHCVCVYAVKRSRDTVLDVSVLDWNVAECAAAADGCI